MQRLVSRTVQIDYVPPRWPGDEIKIHGDSVVGDFGRFWPQKSTWWFGGNPDLTTSWSIAIFLLGGDKAVRMSRITTSWRCQICQWCGKSLQEHSVKIDVSKAATSSCEQGKSLKNSRDGFQRRYVSPWNVTSLYPLWIISKGSDHLPLPLATLIFWGGVS